MNGVGATLASGPLLSAPMEFRIQSGGKLSPTRAFAVCPKCNAPGAIRHSERITETVKHLFVHCSNSGCGHVFKMELAFIHSLVEGNIDRPDLDLPVCPRDQVPHILPPARDGPEADQMTMFDGS
jgi:hypothetical protein